MFFMYAKIGHRLGGLSFNCFFIMSLLWFHSRQYVLCPMTICPDIATRSSDEPLTHLAKHVGLMHGFNNRELLSSSTAFGHFVEHPLMIWKTLLIRCACAKDVRKSTLTLHVDHTKVHDAGRGKNGRTWRQLWRDAYSSVIAFQLASSGPTMLKNSWRA